ncbi:hypothetical protein [Vampirovibrio sp.]|uniref:hypothetical protein n=1 Tax=Vampirovibrio sp. TaxID=2717857 RepID=UPI0035930718
MLKFNPSHKAQNQHAWKDMALNIGKLSLAGLFVTGTVFFCHAYAETPETAQSVPVLSPSELPQP